MGERRSGEQRRLCLLPRLQQCWGREAAEWEKSAAQLWHDELCRPAQFYLCGREERRRARGGGARLVAKKLYGRRKSRHGKTRAVLLLSFDDEGARGGGR